MMIRRCFTTMHIPFPQRLPADRVDARAMDVRPTLNERRGAGLTKVVFDPLGCLLYKQTTSCGYSCRRIAGKSCPPRDRSTTEA
jgi:hypothetical protein